MEPVSIGGGLLPLSRSLALGASVLCLLASPASAIDGIEDLDPEGFVQNVLDTDPGEAADNVTKKLPPPYGEPVHVPLPFADLGPDFQVIVTCGNPDFCIMVGSSPCAGVKLRAMGVQIDPAGLWILWGEDNTNPAVGFYGGYSPNCRNYETVGLPEQLG